MMIHIILEYVKFSICFGITFVIVSSINTPCRYKNMKERVEIGLLMMLLWPAVVVYAVIQEINRFRRRK